MDRRVFFVALIYVLFNMVLESTSSDLNSDGEALLAFSDAVPHSRNLNWKNSPSSVCSSWVGVTCGADQSRVVALRIPAVGLVGRIPLGTIGKLDALQFLSIRNNLLSGDFPSDLLSIPSLQLLNLQNNNFSGNLPFTSFPSSLTIIDFSFNSFTGGIPPAIQNLTKLRFLNVQNNSLSGPIPEMNLPKLRSFNVSNNNLTGPIPASLQSFTTGSFLGNSLLCGPPLAPCSGGPAPSPLPQTPPQKPPSPTLNSEKKISTGMTIAIAAGILTFLLIAALTVLLCLLKNRGKKEDGDMAVESKAAKSSNCGKGEKLTEQYGSGAQEAERNKLVFFDGCSYNFDLEDLLRASAEVLGKGSCGTAYKAVLEDGTIVVVKRLKDVVGKKDFEQQMDIIGKVGQHPNIHPLRAYYYSKDEKLMVFDYLPAGSFSSALHGNRGGGGGGGGRTPLKWENRVKIALGVAKGLECIHSEGGSKFSHGNIKSSNILLNQEMDDALVSDFGLAQLMNFPALPSNMVGYRAPELIETGKFSQKSDVYSFGVLLLELLTAKNALHSPGADEILDLPKWVQSVVREEWTAEVFDSELMSFSHVEEEMVLMLQIAMACVAKSPDQRPKMKDVVSLIVELRHSDSETRLSSDDKSNKDSNVTTPQEEP
ncbi:Receptor-like protein kinase 1-like [Zostera marina]|uniref:Receptor-like protein kinase 1-like n=1 Tax=Zostera marina TaxID=29655 RepID=A0A0K9NPM1_ZOSMR|nr:Receptor-like protein kinase 1-like [Zostera marina]